MALSSSALHTLLYDKKMPISVLLSDLDISTSVDLPYIELLEETTKPIYEYKSAATTIDALSLFDKLLMSAQINALYMNTKIYVHDVPPTVQYERQIINHDFNFDKIVVAYVYGYKLVHNGISTHKPDPYLMFDYHGDIYRVDDYDIFEDEHNEYNNYCDAIANGLRIQKVICEWDIRDAHLRNCTHITHLDMRESAHITSLEPFSASLKTLQIDESSSISNHELSMCTQITKLSINNTSITSLESIAKSLKTLYINDNSIANDDTLKTCTSLESLYIGNKDRITTCDPIAATLRILCLDERCGMMDTGLRLCANIEIFNANNNGRITTCTPFSKSLRVLHANGLCCIGDTGLRLCTNIKELHADGNARISTCEPFGNSLKILYANDVHQHNNTLLCGINDAGLRFAIKLEELHATSRIKKFTIWKRHYADSATKLLI